MCDDRRLRRGWALCALAAMAFALPATADWVDFEFTGSFVRIGAEPSISDDIEPLLSVLVTMPSATQATFTFTYLEGLLDHDGVIQAIYWDETVPPVLGSFFSIPSDWASPATPGDLPEGNDVDPDFVTTASAEEDEPGTTAGINPGESAAFTFNLVDGADYADLGLELTEGDLRMGLFMQSIGDTEFSDHFVSYPPDIPPPPPPPRDPVPLPGAAGLGLLGMVLVALCRRMKGGAPT